VHDEVDHDDGQASVEAESATAMAALGSAGLVAANCCGAER